MFDTFLRILGESLFPARLKKGLAENSLKAGLDRPPYFLFGVLFLIGIVSVVFVDLWFIYNVDLTVLFGINDKTSLAVLQPFFVFVVTFSYLALYFFVVLSAILLYFDYAAFQRTRNMEALLPEFLKSLSENLKGGATLEQALWNSIKPEFGDLSKEMQLVVKRISVGQDTASALLSFANKYDSAEIKRTFSIIAESLESGSKLTPIIDMISRELVDTFQLKKDIATTNLSYVIFIVIIVVFVAPFLFALSTQFLVILQSFISKVSQADLSSVSTSEGFGITQIFKGITEVSEPTMTPEQFTRLAYVVLSMVSLFSSFIISQIKDGNLKSGIKYVPAFLTASLLLFTILVQALSSFFSALL